MLRCAAPISINKPKKSITEIRGKIFTNRLGAAHRNICRPTIRLGFLGAEHRNICIHHTNITNSKFLWEYQINIKPLLYYDWAIFFPIIK
jgi:hypothetical protein